MTDIFKCAVCGNSRYNHAPWCSAGNNETMAETMTRTYNQINKYKTELARVQGLIDKFLVSIRTVHLDMGGKHRYHLTHKSHEHISELKAEAALWDEAKEKDKNNDLDDNAKYRMGEEIKYDNR